MKKHLQIVIAAFLLIGAGCAPQTKIASFEECAAAGHPVMESYPRQCRADGQTFVEDIQPPEPTPLPPPPLPEPEIPFHIPAPFSVGKMRTFDGGLQATLLRIDDSRCPKDVQCVWAGELAPSFELRGGLLTEGAVTVALGTQRTRTAEAGPYVITLRDATETSASIEVSMK